MPQDTLVITPVTPLVNLDTLIGATVKALPMDDPVYRWDAYVGTISEVKINKYGTFARFKSPDLNLPKWIRLERVIGFVHTEESQTTAA